MDFTLFAYTASLFAALLAASSYSHWGVAEVHAYNIPPYMEERGYSARIVANQVVDAVRRMQIEVASLDETRFVVQGQVRPISEVATYFGVFELLRASEAMLGIDPHTVEIEITQDGETAHWRVRGDHAVRGFQVRQGDLPLDDPQGLVNHLGLQVLGYVSPFQAVAYHFIRDSAADSYDTTISTTSALLLDCKRYWSWACTTANVKNAYLLRGVAYLNSGEFARAFDDFESAGKIGAETALDVAFHGDAHAALGQEEAAQREYQRARQLDAGIAERFHVLGRGYADAGNHRLADRRFTTAADLGLESEAFWVDWGDSLYALGWYEAALQRYRRAEAVDPETDLYGDRVDRTLEALQGARPSGTATPPPAPD